VPGTQSDPSARREGEARAFVVAPQPIVRYGLVVLLHAEAGLRCCGEADSAAALRAEVAQAAPHVVLVDAQLPDGSGIEAVGDVRTQCPDAAVLVMGERDDPLYAERALRAGATGFVCKTEAVECFVRAIRAVLRDEIYLSARGSERLLRRLAGPSKSRPFTVEGLSGRELEIFELLGRGLSTAAIAEHLHLSVKTVETHRERIKAKLGMGDGRQLLVHAVKWTLEHCR